ncbi:hypothetical protein [Bradyrhizobium sp. 17]|uniref:hypothetical protein n=1 Tax=Bradyrhizobium sp. 17 TaxID=2782649 RepID=UPI001FF9B938|nr:hypothetical protein [Bradyrhizobium sp. 17]MCK1521998.1 hypothetical protein [Bradyrhizobium sp. 17]
MKKTQLLATLYKMRSNPLYQHAEVRRRELGDVSAMARAEQNTTEYAQIRLLINTWELISTLILQVKHKDFIFETTPVLYMLTELSDAIDIITEEFPDYAANFRLVSKQQAEWLKFKDERYQTGEKSGMHALFG